jgi:hypothetical protein
VTGPDGTTLNIPLTADEQARRAQQDEEMERTRQAIDEQTAHENDPPREMQTPGPTEDSISSISPQEADEGAENEREAEERAAEIAHELGQENPDEQNERGAPEVEVEAAE